MLKVWISSVGAVERARGFALGGWREVVQSNDWFQNTNANEKSELISCF